MTKSLFELCKPRASVFDPQKRDTVLDLTDLVENHIDPAEFFAENYITEGMKRLLEHAMRRLEGKTDQGVFTLKQAMGGGKTHNLLALGLLARHPEFRARVMAGFYRPDPALGPVKVIHILRTRIFAAFPDPAGVNEVAHDLDFNDPETRAEIGQINPTLDNAIAHDIVSDGSAVKVQAHHGFRIGQVADGFPGR